MFSVFVAGFTIRKAVQILHRLPVARLDAREGKSVHIARGSLQSGLPARGGVVACRVVMCKDANALAREHRQRLRRDVVRSGEHRNRRAISGAALCGDEVKRGEQVRRVPVERARRDHRRAQESGVRRADRRAVAVH